MTVNDAYAGRTREEWLNAVALGMAPLFRAARAPLPSRFRVTMSLTRRKKSVGVCYDPSCSGDGTTEILVRLDRFEQVEVAAILAHELVHAAVGCAAGHKGEFRRVAIEIGLEGKMTATTPGERFVEAVRPVLTSVGPFPHAALDFAGRRSGPKPQRNRMVKLTCATCGYVARAARSWIDSHGAPLCPCNEEPMCIPDDAPTVMRKAVLR